LEAVRALNQSGAGVRFARTRTGLNGVGPTPSNGPGDKTRIFYLLRPGQELVLPVLAGPGHLLPQFLKRGFNLPLPDVPKPEFGCASIINPVASAG
jgi:hypothetical protein